MNSIVSDPVLRISGEPFLYYDESAVHRLLTADPVAAFAYFAEGLSAAAQGAVLVEQPPKQIFSDPGGSGDFRIMPCVLRQGNRVRKTIKIVGTNIAQRLVPGQITVGKAFCLHPQENFVTHVFEACLLSSARTGLSAALAMKTLAPGSVRLTVIGAGRVGYYTALYAIANRLVAEVVFHDRDPVRAGAAVSRLSREARFTRASVCPIDLLPATDIVVVATDSSAPVCAPPAWDAKLVISLGADTAHQRELAPEWIECAELYADSLDSLRYGDLRAWLDAGLMTASRVTEFGEVLRNGSPSFARPSVFVSTGLALYDNLAIGYLLECADRTGGAALKR